jgi:enoyl-CoA hydratase/carnithine racemase
MTPDSGSARGGRDDGSDGSTDPTGIGLERQGSTAVIRLCNPPAHAWTRRGAEALKARLAELSCDRGVYALVITGDGDKFFSAGADLKTFSDGDKAAAQAMVRSIGEAFEALSTFRGVTIAALNGYAMGGGLECALACDLRIAEEHVQMALPEAAVGLLPAAGGTQWLPWLVGEGWAKRMILCGERIDAARALAIGLVEEVVPRGRSLPAAMALASRVALQSPGSVAACKALIQEARQRPPRHALESERERFMDLFGTQDQAEGVRAFLEKRPPRWRNA